MVKQTGYSQSVLKVGMKFIKTISDIVTAILISPLVIAIVLLLSPFVLILFSYSLIENIRDNKKLKELLKTNNGQIYFLYADYNNYDFHNYFKDINADVICFNVDNVEYDDLLMQHLIKERGNRAFPRLTKISNGKLTTKVHFDSFKHLYKRKNESRAFFGLIKKSINNLQKEGF